MDDTETEIDRDKEAPRLARSERDFSVDFEGEKAKLQGGEMEVELASGVRLRSAAVSDRGGRPEDQDAVYQGVLGSADDPIGALYILADGMGGESHGDIAAEKAVVGVADSLKAINWEDLRQSLVGDKIRGTISEAARRLVDEDLSNKNTTLVGVVLLENGVYPFGVGDSRVYFKLPDGRLFRATKDDSVVEEGVDEELLEPGEIYTNRWRFIVSKALGELGGKKVGRLGVNEVDGLLLACDGVWEGGERPQHNFIAEGKDGSWVVRTEVPGEEASGGWIGEALEKSPVEAVKELTAQPVGKRSKDNVSAIVVEVKK